MINILIFIAAILSAVPVHAAIGLSTRFVDIEVEDVPVGIPTRLLHLKSRQYSVRNRGTSAMTVQIAARIPRPEDVQPGYEPVPDTSWITIEPDEFVVQPEERVIAKVYIHVPDKPEFKGRHFQVKLKATTVGPYVVAASVDSRLRFNTGSKPIRTMTTETRSLSVSVASQTVTLRKNKAVIKPIPALNRSDKDLNVLCTSIPWDPALDSDGLEPADPSWIKFKSSQFVIRKGKTVLIRPVLKIPNDKMVEGKGYAFLIEIYPDAKPEQKIYSRIYMKSQ